MRRHYNTISSYAFIVCLGFALLLGQASRLHMHVHHDGVASPAHNGHSIALHPAYSQQDIMYDAQYQNDNERPAEIEVGSGSLVKKAESFNSFVLLFTFVCISLYILFLSLFRRKQLSRIERPPVYYLLHPPLRAPPQFTSV